MVSDVNASELLYSFLFPLPIDVSSLSSVIVFILSAHHSNYCFKAIKESISFISIRLSRATGAGCCLTQPSMKCGTSSSLCVPTCIIRATLITEILFYLFQE